MTERNPEIKAYRQGLHEGAIITRDNITAWLRSLDKGGDVNRFLPSVLAQWIEEGAHEL